MDVHKTKEVATECKTILSQILTPKEYGVTDEHLVHAIIVALGEERNIAYWQYNSLMHLGASLSIHMYSFEWSCDLA
eukprot:1788177-Ditylum_brightwellii.AAC.2